MADPTDLNQFPVPSNSFVPASRNAQDLDKLINGGNVKVINRLGVPLDSYEKSIADARLKYGGLNNRGLWVTNTYYEINDLWQSNIDSSWYIVLENYTSGASESIDIASSSVQLYQGTTAEAAADIASDYSNYFSGNTFPSSPDNSVQIGDLLTSDIQAVWLNGVRYPFSQSLSGTISAIDTASPVPNITTENGTTYLLDIRHYDSNKNWIEAWWCVGDDATNNDVQLQLAIDNTVWGDTLYAGVGMFLLSTQMDVGAKIIHIKGAGQTDAFKDSGNRRGRGTIFSSTATGSIFYFDDGGANPQRSRFGSLRDLSIFGNGTSVAGVDQMDGTNTAVEIGNLGINMSNVYIRYVAYGLDIKRSVSARYEFIIIYAAIQGLQFNLQTSRDCFTTANSFDNITIFGDTSSPANTAIWGNSQNQFGGNSFRNINIEACYNGIYLEGTNSARGIGQGAGAWGTESTFAGVWIERMASNGYFYKEFSDSSVVPLITFKQFHTSPVDYTKFITAAGSQTTNYSNNVLGPLDRVDADVSMGQVGEYVDGGHGGGHRINGVNTFSVESTNMQLAIVQNANYNRQSDLVAGYRVASVSRSLLDSTSSKTASFAVDCFNIRKPFIIEVDVVGENSTGAMGYISNKSVYNYRGISTVDVTPIYSENSRFELTTSVSIGLNRVIFYISKIDTEPLNYNMTASIKMTISGSGDNTSFESRLVTF